GVRRGGACGGMRSPLCRAGAPRAALGAPPNPAHRRLVHRIALRPRAQSAPRDRPAAPGARAAPHMMPARMLLVLLALLAWPAWAKGSYAEREEVQEFIRALAVKHGFAEQDLRYLF